MIHQFNAAQRRRGLQPSTIERREYALRMFEAWLDPGTLADATEADIEAFIDTRPWSSKTIYGFLSHLAAYYRWAIRTGICERDPSAFIDRPRLRQGLPRPIADDDLALLISQASPTMRAWLILGAFAGLRCAEIAGLHRDDIIDTHGYMRILGKGNKERIVPLHPLVIEALRAAGMPRSGPLWRTVTGLPTTGATVSQQGGAFMRSQGVDASMHQLRHWFGTRSYQACQDLLAVAGLMGHSNTATTRGYAAFDQKVATAAVLALTI